MLFIFKFTENNSGGGEFKFFKRIDMRIIEELEDIATFFIYKKCKNSSTILFLDTKCIIEYDYITENISTFCDFKTAFSM